ncbi:Lysine-specific permease [Smittium culicis]|uniref:Lysine-specific permease n=1 Tax=Smittium culicis TaxID=133412 RepID=A0A1R1Y3K2_9FUNG|nr:Lysine-specific permease [Smittium culicis]
MLETLHYYNRPVRDTEPNRAVSQDYLKRRLKSRHMSMIALGGTIGNGLFIASGPSLAEAGPLGTLAAYSILSFIVYFLITSLTEMSTYIPVAGSFNSFADRFVEPAFGVAMSYNYWYSWVITAAINFVSCGLVIQYWLPHTNPVIWSFAALIIIFTLNLFGPKVYGESEFALTLIKIVAIMLFIIIGFLVGFGAIGGKNYGFSKFLLKNNSFANGFTGTLHVFVTAAFSFQGVEIVGITSGESKNPSKDVPRAMHSVFFRVVSFYLLVVLVIGMVVSYNDPSLIIGDPNNVSISPLVTVMEKGGIKYANHIINAVILTSALSAGSTCLYMTTRILFSLAVENKLFNKFKKVTSNGTPIYCLLFGSLVAIIIFSISLIDGNSVYHWLVAFNGIAGMLAWMGILFTHYRFRKAYNYQGFYLDDLPYKARLYPFGLFFSFFSILFITLAQGYKVFKTDFNFSEFFQAYGGIPIFLIIYLFYKFWKKSKVVGLSEMDLLTDSYNQLGFISERYEKKTIKDKVAYIFF